MTPSLKSAVRRALPTCEWPAADLAAWQRAREPGDVLEPGGPAESWSPATVKKREQSYGRWLGFLARSGQLDGTASPGDRVTPEKVAAYVQELSTLNSTSTVIAHLEELRAIARVMDPTRDWSWLGRVAARLGQRRTNTLRKRARLRPTQELFELGFRLMAEATDPTSGTPLQRAVRFRDGLVIALLAARPIRRAALAALQISQFSRRGDTLWVALPANAMKNRTPMEFPLPPPLSGAIHRYVAEYRRILLGGTGSDAFWVSKVHTQMGDDALYQRIVKLTEEAFGTSICPHLFRDAAVTTIAIDDPEHVQIGATLLGHQSLRISEKHYNQAQMIHACRRYQGFVTARRRSVCKGDRNTQGSKPSE